MFKKIIFISIITTLFLLISCTPEIQYIEVEKPSDPATTTPDTTPPLGINNLKITTGDSKAIISWDLPTDEDLFAIKIYNAELTSRSLSLDDGILINPNNCSYIIYNLQNGKEYKFKVSAVDKSLNESTIATITGTPRAADDSIPPNNISNIISTVGANKVLLDWINPADEDLFGIIVSMSPSESSLKTPILLRTGSSFEISGLQNNKQYTFTIKTIDNSLNESSGISINATPIDSSDITPPSNISNLTKIVGDSKILLDWINPTDEDLFGVIISMNPNEGSLTNPILLRNGSSFEISGLQNNNQYSFTIKTIDNSLNESSGISISGTPIGLSDTTSPSNITNLSTTIGDKTILLDWRNPSDSDFMGVVISMSPSTSSLKSPVILRNSHVFEIGNLENDLQYTFTVKSIDYSLNESSGISIKGTPIDSSDKTPPSPISNLVATPADKDILLEWQNPTDSDFSGVEISMSPAESSLVKPIRILKASSFAIGNLINGKTYTFTIKAFDINNNFSTSKTVFSTPIASEVSPMQIQLIKNTNSTTKENIIVTVNPVTASDIKKITYKKGSYESPAVLLSEGTEIIKTSSKYTFEVFENGIYSVAVQDMQGRRECKTINITNIDKIAPSEITNLTYQYILSDETILLNWSNPTESDFNKLYIEYTDNENNTSSQELDKSRQTFTITNIRPSQNNKTYHFIIKTIDNVGNISTGKSFDVIISAMPYISNILLSRNHISNNDENKKILVTAYGNNFEKLQDMEDSTIYIQVLNGDDITSYLVTDIDIENNRCQTEITLPKLSSVSDVGTDFIVRSKVCGVIDINNTSKINISKDISFTSISISTNNFDSNTLLTNQTFDVTVNGTNLDIPLSPMYLYILDSEGNLYKDYIIDPPTDYKAQSVTISNIPVPLDDDIYSIHACGKYFESWWRTVYSSGSNLTVYSTPKFESISIPSASIHKMDQNVTAIIKGKNFTTSNFNKNNISIDCSKSSIISNSINSIKVLDNNFVEIQFTIPNIVGNYPITVSYGSSTVTSNFEVKDFTNWSTGDILFSDGTHSPSNDYDETKTPIAIVLQNEYGYCYAVGLHTTWTAMENDNVSNNNILRSTPFKTISCKYYSYSPVRFIGDLEGYDNWQEICNNSSILLDNMKKKYPAFYFVENYANEGDTNLLGTEYEENWFIPSINEVQLIVNNMSTINTSLRNLGLQGIQSGTYLGSSSTVCEKTFNGYLTTRFWWNSSSTSSTAYQTTTPECGNTYFPFRKL